MFDQTTIQLMNLAATRVGQRKAIRPEVIRVASCAVEKTAERFGGTYVENLDILAKES